MSIYRSKSLLFSSRDYLLEVGKTDQTTIISLGFCWFAIDRRGFLAVRQFLRGKRGEHARVLLTARFLAPQNRSRLLECVA